MLKWIDSDFFVIEEYKRWINVKTVNSFEVIETVDYFNNNHGLIGTYYEASKKYQIEINLYVNAKASTLLYGTFNTSIEAAEYLNQFLQSRFTSKEEPKNKKFLLN